MPTILLMLLLVLLPSWTQAETLYTCQQGSTVIYTNHTIRGASCTVLHPPALSTVPSPRRHRTPVAPDPAPVIQESHDPVAHDYPLLTDSRQSLTINPSVGPNVGDQICDLYGKWLDLNLLTRGGLYYSPLTAPFMTLFGGGFIPMECRR